MKPGFPNYLGAQAIPLAAHGGGIIALAQAAWLCRPNFEPPLQAWIVGQTLVALAAAYLLGMILGTMLLWPFLRLWARKMNGGPFTLHDRVLILAGRHKGRIASIYELWPTRAEVRVDLGGEERKNITDVVGDHQILRLA